MNEFLANFRTRRILCETLLSLSDREDQAVEAGDYDTLTDLVARKDRVLNRLRDGQEFVDQWRQTRDQGSSAQRQECQDLLDYCEATLLAVQQRTQHATQRVVGQRQATIEQIQRVTAGQRVRSEYLNDIDADKPLRRLDLVR